MSTFQGSNFDVSITEAYVFGHHFHGEQSVVLPAIELTEDINIIKNAISENIVLSYIDIGNTKKHFQVLFYNTKELCDEYKETCQAFESESIKSLDSNESITCQGATMAWQEKINSIYFMVKKLTESVEDLKLEIRDIKSQRIGLQIGNIGNVTCKEAVKRNLKDEFTQIINTKRMSREWRQKMSQTKFHDLPSKNIDIKKLMVEGPDEAGVFMRRLARILFGERQIKENLMGIDGKRLKGLKQGDRAQLFSPQEELQILEILKNIDQELFISHDAFQHLIREPINQCGRDLNKYKNKRPAPPSFKPITDFFRPKQPTGPRQQDIDRESVPSTSGTAIPRTEISVTINHQTIQGQNVSSSEPQNEPDRDRNVSPKTWFERFYSSVKKN